VGYWSTAEVRGGARIFRPLMTTPEAPELHRFLAEVRGRGIRHAVMEVSSHAVALERIATLQFRTAVVTNLSPDHLDFHRTFAEYRAAKEGLVSGLPPGGVAVLNQDDPEVRTFAVPTAVRTIRYGVQTQGELNAVHLEEDDTQSRFELLVDGWLGEEASAGGRGPYPVCLSLPGRHNVYNALAAVGAALSLGVPMPKAIAALAQAKPPVRRLEAYREGPYTVVNDVAMNRASYDAVLETMRRWGKPLVVVNALRGNRGEQVNRDIALALAEWDRRLGFAPLIVTLSESQVSHLAADYRVRPEELQSFLQAADQEGLAVECFRELPEAIARGVERLVPGGILLLLGTFGMDDGAALAREVLRQRLGKA
ncbi:MAG: UDP-N-acetylmuramyl peptide synthase, partial [Firmicutes bacterium]|nr:UDP-N-acetylmuramyl peptide synthase [Bacillota bacterium]